MKKEKTKLIEDVAKDTANGQPIQVIGSEEVISATHTLNEYKQGKSNLEQRIVENEQWFKMRHWEQLRNKDDNSPHSASAWLFNSLMNKHADAMDNYPEPNVLPREESDEETAKVLTSVLPTILEQNQYDSIYSDTWWYKLRTGTGVKGVFWNADKNNGLGDVDIQKIDILNLFWEPGVNDIQDSKNLFNVKLVDVDIIKSKYPQCENISNSSSVTVADYVNDDTIDTSKKVAVIDWYYKKIVNGKTVLHYVNYVNDVVLYASENDPDYAQRGFYDHGLYPFVFDIMFPDEGTPCGFGYIDIMKDCQLAIDSLDNDIIVNTKLLSKPRYFVRNDGGVNEKEFANWENDFVHVDGNNIADNIVQMQVNSMSNLAVQHRQAKIDELKETSGNRDFNQGGTASGVTAASAIATLQESGSKLSRDNIKSAYRAYAKECYIIIELIRQFYDNTRVFRITGAQGDTQFTEFDNSVLQPQPQSIMGMDLGERLPIFDIKIVPQKQNPYAKQSQNELALQFFGSGFFNPQLSDQALAALDIMQFDDKEKIVKKITENGTMYQQIQQLTQQIQQMAQIIDSSGLGGLTNLGGEFEQQQGNEQEQPNGSIATNNNLVEDNKKLVATGGTI